MNNKFIIVLVNYNNEPWVESCLNSVFIQDYNNYEVLLFDNLSTDKSLEKIQPFTKDPRLKIFTYPEKIFRTGFYHRLEKEININDNDILLFLDGDDMFYCENVLSYINEIYNKSGCWITYGGMIVWEGGEKTVEPFPQNSEIPSEVKLQKLYRKDLWRTSHLKTTKGFLWKRLNKEDLKPTGTFGFVTEDLIIMYGMMEMCPPEKIYRITEPVYLFNNTPENCQRRNDSSNIQPYSKLLSQQETIIRTKTPYDTLSVICPTLAGGLGNQMFEVAAAASLAKDNNAVLLLNPNEHILPNQGRNVNTYLSNVFSKITIDITPPVKTLYQWDHAFYKQIPYQPNLKLNSHFQSYKYFDHNREFICWLFSPTPEVQDTIINRYDIGKAGKSTAIQVRRGDYIKFPNHHPLLPLDYYTKAVKMAAPEEIWVFSDDIKWCQENLHLDCPVKYIQDEDYIELYLMTLCKNVIISNSSFGWWAAYLNRRENHKVFAPSPWFGPAIINDGFKINELILPEWNEINYE